MPRFRRLLAVAVGALAVAGLRRRARSRPRRLRARWRHGDRTTPCSTYLLRHLTHCRKQVLDLPTVTLGADAKALIDVPHTVKSNGWQVQALSLQDITKVLGTSGPITDSHSYRVASNADGSPFLVRVDELDGGKPDGSTWSFVVRCRRRSRDPPAGRHRRRRRVRRDPRRVAGGCGDRRRRRAGRRRGRHVGGAGPQRPRPGAQRRDRWRLRTGRARRDRRRVQDRVRRPGADGRRVRPGVDCRFGICSTASARPMVAIVPLL